MNSRFSVTSARTIGAYESKNSTCQHYNPILPPYSLSSPTKHCAYQSHQLHVSKHPARLVAEH